MIKYEFHPFANIFPMMEGEAFHAFVKDIEARGQQEPIWLYEGKILEGRNRYRACELLKREVQTKDYIGNDPIGFVLSANVHRRHLTEAQRAMVGASLADLVTGANQHTKGGLSASAAAALLKVGTASIERARVILRSGDPDLIKAVTEGRVSVTAAAKQSKPNNGKPKPDKKPKPPKNLSGKIEGLVKSLVAALKEWKAESANDAITATSNLIGQLKAADLIEARGKKAA
jgi:hypothetical protein